MKCFDSASYLKNIDALRIRDNYVLFFGKLDIEQLYDIDHVIERDFVQEFIGCLLIKEFLYFVTILNQNNQKAGYDISGHFWLAAFNGQIL